MHRPVYYNVFLRQFQGGKEKSRLKRKKFTKNPHARFGAPKFMKAFAAHGDFFASAAVAPQGASRWHLNQIYCECEAFTVKPRRVCRPQAAKKLESHIYNISATV